MSDDQDLTAPEGDAAPVVSTGPSTDEAAPDDGGELLLVTSSPSVIELTGSWMLQTPYVVMDRGAELAVEHLSDGVAVTAPVGWRVHVPTHSGVRYVHVPEGWSAVVPLATRCAVFENGETFINLTCREPDYTPSDIEIGSDGGRCQLTWAFKGSQQPSFRLLQFDSWSELITDHRDWMLAHTPVRTLEETAPAWLRDCPAMVYIDIETIDGQGLHHSFEDVANLADALAAAGAPPNTTVYLTTWNDGGERRWPTYEASSKAGGLAALVHAAGKLREHGYRLMLHANVWGCSPIHPEYTSLISAVVHNRAGHPLGWREFHQRHVSQYVYCWPDSRAFLEVFWGSLEPVLGAVGADALFLDQAGILVDDPTHDILTATRRLISVIRETYPDLVLGGQAISSRLTDVIPLWQLWGTPWSGHGWGQPFRRRSPLITDLFRGLARFCAHRNLPAAVPGRFLSSYDAFADDLGVIGCFLAAQEDNSYHNAMPCVRLNFRDHGIDPLSHEVLQQAARRAAGHGGGS